MRIDANRPVTLVTGASSGIGKSTAIKLIALGWQVIGVGRDPQRSAAAEAEIAAAPGGESFNLVRADFTVMAQVKRAAEEVASRTGRLDVLINNAGGVRDRQYITADGTEATFAANHLAPFLLTRELMPLLTASAASQPPGTTRVIAVSSTAHRMIDALDFGHQGEVGAHHREAAIRRRRGDLCLGGGSALRVAADADHLPAEHCELDGSRLPDP